MATQLISDGFFPTSVPASRSLTGYAAPRLKLPRGADSQLARLSAAELNERSATIEAEISELGRILGVFLLGLVLLGLVIALAA